MNAKYATPSTATNVPAISNIFGRLARPANNDSMNISTHIEQGLNPSRSPITIVNSGRPRFLTRISPNHLVWMLSMTDGGAAPWVFWSSLARISAPVVSAERNPIISSVPMRKVGTPMLASPRSAVRVASRCRATEFSATSWTAIRSDGCSRRSSSRKTFAASQWGQPARTKTSRSGTGSPAWTSAPLPSMSRTRQMPIVRTNPQMS